MGEASDCELQDSLTKAVLLLSPPSPSLRGRSLQESFIKLVEACNDPSAHMDRWLSRLEASKWLSHVKEALNAACLAAQCLER